MKITKDKRIVFVINKDNLEKGKTLSHICIGMTPETVIKYKIDILEEDEESITVITSPVPEKLFDIMSKDNITLEEIETPKTATLLQ